MSRADLWASNSPQPGWRATVRTIDALRSAGPPLLFGVRLWASVCLALYVAFELELDNAYWAGTTAAIVCQPQLGASLRKASFRMIGTLVGAVAIVVLTALFPQDRVGFLLGLALWGAACGFVATILRNFAAYAAALAGFTAAIVASDELGATGGPNGQAFMLAVTRASEIWIGIVCAGVVLAGTDLGSARRRLVEQFAAISAEIAGQFVAAFSLTGPEQGETRLIRRDLIRRVIALDPIIDQAIGEASDLRYRSRELQAAVGGLFATLFSWRTIALHLELAPNDQSRSEAEVILQNLPQQLKSEPALNVAASWTADPSHARRACFGAARAVTALRAGTPSLQLLTDAAAEAMLGMARALNGLARLADPGQAIVGPEAAELHVADWLPAFVNAARVFVTIVVAELFWIATAWPNGALAMTFAAIFVILFSPQVDRAYTTTKAFLFGTSLTAVFAAIIKFALLPQVETFAGFGLVIGLVLAPAGALMAQPRQAALFTAMTVYFIPLVAPANQMTYDTQQFYNSALAIVAGVGSAALAFRLLPPPSPATRTRRLLDLTLRDLRRLAKRPKMRTREAWESRVYSRLLAMPDQAETLQRAQLLATVSVGSEIIRLRNVAPRFGVSLDLDAALDALARGQSATAIERLAELDRALAALPGGEPEPPIRLRARASILAMSEAFMEFGSYFDAGASA